MGSFCKCKSYSHFFSKNISIYAIFNDQSFNDTLTNDIVSFEQLGPDILFSVLHILLLLFSNNNNSSSSSSSSCICSSSYSKTRFVWPYLIYFLLLDIWVSSIWNCFKSINFLLMLLHCYCNLREINWKNVREINLTECHFCFIFLSQKREEKNKTTTTKWIFLFNINYKNNVILIKSHTFGSKLMICKKDESRRSCRYLFLSVFVLILPLPQSRLIQRTTNWRDFSYFSQKNRLWHFMQIVSWDNLHEMPKPFFSGKK